MKNQVLKNIQYKGFSDWFIQFSPFEPLWKNQPTYMLVQASFLLGGFLTLVHAVKAGGRFRWLWPATIFHGLVVESICYIMPDVDNFWHSQTPIMFLGHRLPLHIVFLYPCYIYQASVAAAQLKLPKWAEPFAVGLLVVLIDIPYDIASVKFVHWTWHDTDPNIADRHYWVPWNSYYFHLSFAASFTFWFHTVRAKLDKQAQKWKSSRFGVELVSTCAAAVFGPIGGITMFLPIYHPLHDIYHIHSEVTFFILLSMALLVVWSGSRTASEQESDIRMMWRALPLLALAVHYTLYFWMVVWADPEKEISVGLHEPIGPCNLSTPVQTLFGVLKKNKYLCTQDYNEDYFDFHCLSQGSPKGMAIWYTICGTPFENRVEYIVILATLTVLALGIFGNIYFYKKSTNKVKLQHRKTKYQ